ncbi:hypothetical protein CPB86DRAFT_870669 [Serendipita vermifera]|nr:hypothetical protein CPB86DRAFT_870669 [Serendipita vermifera]
MSQDLIQGFASWGKDHGFELTEISTIISQLPYIIQNISASRYMSAVGMIVVLWDTIITLPDEVQFIWPMPFGLIKSIWIFSRYLVPGLIIMSNYQFMEARPALTDRVCQVYIIFLIWIVNISFAASNWLLLLRVSALWGRRRSIIYPLYAFYVGLYFTITVIVGVATASMSDTLFYDPFIKVCSFMTRIPKAAIHSQWLPIIFDIVIFILTAVKAKQDNIALQRGSRQTAPVLFILFRDGGIYCVLIIALRIINFAAWAFMDESLVYVMIVFLWAMVTTLINRFYLNLRRVAYATAAAILTNASVRERPVQPVYGYYHGGVGATAGAHPVDTYARKGAQSPWIDLEDGRSPILDIIRNGVVDEVVIAEVERQRATQGGLAGPHGSGVDATGGDRSWYNRTTDFAETDEEEPIPLQPPAHGILVSQGVVIY